MRAAPMAMMAPTGTKTPTELARLGTHTNSTTMKMSGVRAIFQLRETYTTASPPNSAAECCQTPAA